MAKRVINALSNLFQPTYSRGDHLSCHATQRPRHPQTPQKSFKESTRIFSETNPVSSAYAKDAVDRGEVYAYAHRRNRTEFRQLGSSESMQPAVRKVCVTENLSTD